MTTRRGFLEKAGAFIGGVVATKLVSRDAIPAPKIEPPVTFEPDVSRAIFAFPSIASTSTQAVRFSVHTETVRL